MASIHKLSVRGIRAFSPEDEEQVISFCFPLTIIVGANGCGKTTIIEALKYAVTGSLPPGNKSGQAFVHDPKSVGSSQVKAAVKLRFNNRAGKSMVVVRSMELTQKKTNMQFKQLDGIIRTTDDRGNKVSLSHKCSELDRQIPQLLGVSKAILDHVVFCHQEDSSWPLMEGAVLKRRFDDIFDSTRYVKALEAIKDTRKGLQSKFKDLKVELGELNGHKHASMGFRQELDKCRQKLSEHHDDMKNLDDKIQTEKQQCQEYGKTIQQSNTIQEEIESNITTLEKADVEINTHRKGLIEDLSKSRSREELKNMIRAFDRQMQGDVRELEDMESTVRHIESLIEKGKEKKITLSGEKGELMGEKKLYDDNLHKRVTLMEELATTYGLELSFSQTQQSDVMNTQRSSLSIASEIGHDIMSSQGTTGNSIYLTAEDLRAFARSVSNKRKQLEIDLDDYRDESRKAEDSIQSELSNLTAKVTTMETDISRLSAERVNALQEMKSLPRSSSRMRKGDIDEAKRSANSFADKRDKLNRDERLKTIPRDIEEKDIRISKMKGEIDGLNNALKELRKCAEDQNNIDILVKQVRQDSELIEEMKGENDFLLKYFKIKLPDVERGDGREVNDKMDSILLDVESKLNTTTSEYDKAIEEQKKSSDQVSKVSALLSHKKETLEYQNEQLSVLNKDGRGVQGIKNVIKMARQFETKHGQRCDIAVNANPQQLQQYFTKRLGELSSEELQPEGVSKVIRKLRKLAKFRDETGTVVDIQCPCCARPMKGKEIEVFEQEMKDLADPVNSAIVKSEQHSAKLNRSALSNYEKWRNLINRYINDWMDHQRITDDVERLKGEIIQDKEELSTSQSALTEDREKVESLKDEVSNAQQMQDLARRLRDEIGKIMNKKSQISTRREELKLIAPRASGKDLLTTEREVNAKMEEKDSLLNQISAMNKEISILNDSINQANISATRAENIVREKEQLYAQEQENSEKRKKLNESVAASQEKETKIQQQIAPVRQKVNLKETEKNRLRATTQTTIDKKSKFCTQFNHDAEKIDILTTQIEDFKSGDNLQRLETIDTEINSVSQEVHENEDELRQTGPKLKSLQSKVDDQDAYRKNVERNIELLDMISEKQKLVDEISLLEQDLKELDGDSIQQEYSASQKKIRRFESEKDRHEGGKDALQRQQRDLKRKLKTNEYENVDERHRVKMIETETTSMAVQDLDLYHSAFDKALLKYHGLKIQEINKIIKELWALTYRGEDITNIRLTSDQESNSRSSRSYNYRVVMTKGTTELDMRGRCSAGQRVLASIVIRLALAETFCVNCGVMALDEPTTNLDFANKRGLAIALAQIIANRAAQDNFQLVTITHDEEFVSMMKNELSTHTGLDMPERYFQVSREEGNDGCYYSKIHAIDWEDL